MADETPSPDQAERTIRVAVVQLRVDDSESADARTQRVAELVESQSGSADLVVLPELWKHGAFATAANLADTELADGPTGTRMAQAAAAAGLYLHAGSIAERPVHAAEPGAPPRRPYNASLVFGPDGRRVARYRKIHLFGFDSGEAAELAAGSMPVSWKAPWGVIGLATCYDLRFPELFRALVEHDAEAFLVPSGWPAARIGRWDVLAQARAIENQAYLIGANCVGTHAGHLMGGRSVVVDPTGEILAQGSDADEEILRVTVDLAAAAAWREDFPALRDRRL